MRFDVNGIRFEIAGQQPAERERRNPRVAHLPMHQRLVKWFGEQMPFSVSVGPTPRTHAAPPPDPVNGLARAVKTLSDLDRVIARFGAPPDASSGDDIVRLPYADRSRLLGNLAQQLPVTPDVPDPYRSLARNAILQANAGMPPEHRQALLGLERGGMFAHCEQAVDCGVPVGIAAGTFNVRDPARIEFLDWKAAYVAAGHVYAGASVTEAALDHGISLSDPRVLVPLQRACVETVAGAAVVCGTPVEEVAREYGITDADEIDQLHSYRALEHTAFIKALVEGRSVDDAYRDFPGTALGERHRAEYIAAMSPVTTAALKAGETPDAVGRRLNISDPFVRRLLERRAAEARSMMRRRQA